MIGPIVSSWNAFWFAETSTRRLVPVRLVTASAAAIWFASFLPGMGYWFGEAGLLDRATSSRLLDFAEVSRWQQWSPLWLTDSLIVYQAWVMIGVLLAFVLATGLGGRITAGVVLLWSVAWIHRVFWLSSSFEPALAALLAYLVIQPGASILGDTAAKAPRSCLTANISWRLVQVHIWLLVFTALATQLASLTWWRGEPAWWLTASGRSNLLSLGLFEDRPWLVNAISHSVVALEATTLWFLAYRASRPLGVVLGIGVCLCLALISDQILYALLIGGGMLAFWPAKERAAEEG